MVCAICKNTYFLGYANYQILVKQLLVIQQDLRRSKRIIVYNNNYKND